MALPRLNTQKFELMIPSTDKKVKYRPFLVKEEKILLQAQQSGKATEMADALVEVIENCTFADVKVDNLPSFDIEYIFLKIRSKSVGEKVTLNVTCPDDNETKVKHTVDLSKIEVEVEEDHTNTIELTDSVKVIMSYPTIKTFSGASVNELDAEQIVKLTTRCIHQIVDGVETYEAADLSEAELVEFVENLTVSQLEDVTKFFDAIPRLQKEVVSECKLCGKDIKKKVVGLQNFF